jgi:activator of Hsp90 ATPase-like protein
MKKENFSYSFKSSKTPTEVFELLPDVEQWWSGFYEETIKGKSQQVNDEFTFNAGGGAHYSKQKLVELIPDKKITWLVTDSKLNFLSDTNEWTGTRICFDISTEENMTRVTFTHDGLVPEVECYNACSSGWTKYLGKLKSRLQ